MARLTLGQYWKWLTDDTVGDDLLRWPADIAALTSAALERSHAYRFVVSPPAGRAWPTPEFGSLVKRAAEDWVLDVDTPPDELTQHWRTIVQQLDTPLDDVAQGRAWPVCEALLTLHAIADETGSSRPSTGAAYRAQARERLIRTGSMARLPTDRIVYLPKSRTTSVGITHRSLSRYGATTTDGIRAVWDRVPIRRRGTHPVVRHVNILLLPWPLRIRETDFVPVHDSVHRPEREPFGFFTYEPSEPLDLGLVDSLISAAREEVDDVDVVVLPEGCLDADDAAALEGLLADREILMLVTGLRPAPDEPGQFAGNAVHTGILSDGSWSHYQQRKHHRWFLDGGQIEAYNIAGALHPQVRWWEAMQIPERSVHLLDVGGSVTVAAVVCEDLARLDGVSHLLRSVAPTLVLTLLLDGPQLGTRWTARYAGVLADDPGSAVLTLTALGMASRSRPAGMPPSRVVAMWKDPRRGVREIALEPGAQAVLLTAVLEPSARYAADGRAPVDDVTDLYIAGVHQLQAQSGPTVQAGTSMESDMDPRDLSVLAVWQEAGPAAAVAASPDAPWRKEAGLPIPTGALAEALRTLAT